MMRHAITAPQRQPDLPDVPTTREAGMPGYTYGSFFAVYVRAGTPAEIVALCNKAKPKFQAAIKIAQSIAPIDVDVDSLDKREAEIIKLLNRLRR